MIVMVVDGQGGRLGASLTEKIKKACPEAEVLAIGTNSAATAAMLKAGADEGATGENPVRVASKRADVITGPVGIIMADSLLGEVTAKMAESITAAEAKKVLIPMNKCNTLIAGINGETVSDLTEDAVKKICRLAAEEK